MNILRRIAPCLTVAGLFIGCDADTPTEQRIDVRSPAFSAAQDWIRDQFYADNWADVDCLGEKVHCYGWVPYQWHRVTSASGGWNYHFQMRPYTPNLPPFVCETESGRVYEYKDGAPVNESFHSGPNETYTLIDKETAVAENGDRLLAERVIHYTINANGDLTVGNVTPGTWTCRSKNK